MASLKPYKVLFICMGNICRSPTAHGVFRQQLIEQGLMDVVEVDSAGTHAYHVGKQPDQRSMATAKLRGIDMGDLTARQIDCFDFEYYDYLLVADQDNFDLVHHDCPKEHRHKIGFILDYAKHSPVQEVPDPYYGGADGFERVFDLIEDACEGLIRDIQGRLVQDKL